MKDNQTLDPITLQKKNAALRAVEHVKDGCVVGLGSGSTAAFAIQAIGERMKTQGIYVLGVPTSYQAFLLAVECGIPLTTLDEHPVVDVTIDGADQLTSELFLIKGGGAALAREKIVAASSKQNIIIADEKKLVSKLGANNQFVPVEVLPFALPLAKRKIAMLGGNPITREGKGKLGPVITDNGNAVLDVFFGEIADPASLAVKVKMVAGVVETGFFVGLTDFAYIGTAEGVKQLSVARSSVV
ncbi:MAG: ribose-5-phosphate isomerase RpiA [Candidatus Bathyarchaeota archaeon]|nr:ribose-5-phosphate isomerase RpiA [Candidatus Bathyarchaeota archaeon]